MAKGFLSGVVSGTVVSVLGLGVVSLQLSPVPPDRFQPAQVEETDPVVTEQPETEETVAEEPAPEAPEVSDTPPDAISAPNAAAEDDMPAEESTDDAPVSDAPTAPATPPTPDAKPTVDTDAPKAAPGASAQAAPENSEQSDSTDTESPAPDSDEADTSPQEEAAPLPQSIPELANTPQIKSDPVAPIGNQTDNVTTNRLPTIEAAPAAENEDQDQDQSGALSLAIEFNATPFENPEGRPLMSVVLFDQGGDRSLIGDLNNLPFPVSFIVQADASDVSDAIRFYRNAGAEVIIAPTLPDGATPSDAEVIFQAQSAVLDQAVAVFMGKSSGFQSNSPLAAQISEILVEKGHGLVSEPQGLSTGHKTALKTGVPAGLVFRELDSEGQDGDVMRRFLDNAAFKAGQENGVIMLGHARAETLQALIEWNLGNRAKSVAMAPVSALLLSE